MNANFRILATVCFSALLASCATSPRLGEATVCPDCETVFIDDIDMSKGTDFVNYRLSHECPGCQGALITFFKEGKLQHRCSICSKKGFSCPINHPVKKSS